MLPYTGSPRHNASPQITEKVAPNPSPSMLSLCHTSLDSGQTMEVLYRYNLYNTLPPWTNYACQYLQLSTVFGSFSTSKTEINLWKLNARFVYVVCIKIAAKFAKNPQIYRHFNPFELPHDLNKVCHVFVKLEAFSTFIKRSPIGLC